MKQGKKQDGAQLRRRSVIFGALAVPLSLSLAACTTDTQGSKPASSPAAKVSIRHEFGTTVLDHVPSRVVTLGRADIDIAMALNGAVILMNDRSNTAWLRLLAKEKDVNEPDRYDIGDLLPYQLFRDWTPDLFLATDYALTKDEYAQLAQIAPVIARPIGDYAKPDYSPWKVRLDMIATALRQQELAQTVLQDTLKAQKAATEDYPGFDAITLYAADVRLGSDAAPNIYSADTILARDLSEFGLTYVASKTFLETVGHPTDDDPTIYTVSPETAAGIEAEVFIGLALDGMPEPDKEKELTYLSYLPAARTKSVLLYDGDLGYSLVTPSPAALIWAGENVIPEIAKAGYLAKHPLPN